MIGFRVDANETIATGHLMRCMAIAKGFRNKGEEVIFFLAEEKETKRLKEQDLPYVILHSGWRNLEQELPVFKQVLTQYPVTKLIVDSYQATRHYLESLNQNVKTIYMDDMGTEYYPIAGVIHYSNWPWDTAYEKRYENMDTICMAGMQYTPLREEFYPKEDCVDEECSKEDCVNEFYPKEDYVDEVCLKKDYVDEECSKKDYVDEECSKKKYMDEECSKKNYVDEVDSKEEYLKEENIENTDREKNILITTGGTDPYNIAGRLLAYAKTQMECQSDMGKMFSKAHFLVISGSMN